MWSMQALILSPRGSEGRTQWQHYQDIQEGLSLLKFPVIVNEYLSLAHIRSSQNLFGVPGNMD